MDGETPELDRRRVSVQWFSGTILTGLCGAALMGGAVFAALDGEANFAASPERFEAGLRGTLGAQAERLGMRKGDRLPLASEAVAARQVIRISTTSRAGDRELVRVRPYVKVASNLALSTTDLSADIPRFDPQKMIADPADGAAAREEAASAALPDAEVSFVTRDLSSVLPRAKVAKLVAMDDVVARVREVAHWTGGAGVARYASADFTGSTRLAYAVEGTPDPYAGFEARIIPENITLLPKTSKEITGGSHDADRVVTVKKGDTAASILAELGASESEIDAIVAQLGAYGRKGGLKEGQRLEVLLSPAPGGRKQPVRVLVVGDTVTEAAVALSDMGRYVPVDIQSAATQQVADVEDDENDDGSGVRLYQSLYETALRNEVPRSVIADLVRIYSYDVDFQRKVQVGDSFEVVYEGEDDPAGHTEVLYANLTVGGETKAVYRFRSPDDGQVDYYDESGKSARKFLVRKPVSNGIMRSGFGVRRHPILGYTKMHTGIDWAAPMGTPIYAAGSGTIVREGWESGYGKFILLRHANGYETAYGHMSAYAKGTREGEQVRQGQVIGFVGSTGLSTGSHVHYEIRINGRYVDPMRVKLPRGRVLEGQTLTAFKHERERIEGMIGRTPARFADSQAH
ncbi:Peptidase M23/M37 [Rhodovulum sp. PH10]|uniref:peptidoglycan DD-metalloendopeptidase family protein n=1 Tax=Rhodovulum sp. PH10 TaxID=1187851 RepID=UPI00027C2E1B|nr:peptidoglycan DD-metalloendopeptidase family protein [Rhodovulum sp. PH10]EJW11004.1 Peptidase M23/M37 [Rhodovulum sp. PH10]